MSDLETLLIFPLRCHICSDGILIIPNTKSTNEQAQKTDESLLVNFFFIPVSEIWKWITQKIIYLTYFVSFNFGSDCSDIYDFRL